MASTKKPSGLGRGLDELLDDNAPTTTKRVGRPLVEPKGEATKSAPVEVNGTVYEVKTKTLYNTKPKTNSLKSNFKKNS